MRFDVAVDTRHGLIDAPLQRADARLKIVFTLGLVVAIVATPLGAWRGLAAEGLLVAFLVGVSGVPPADLGRRWLGYAVLFGFLTLTVAPGRPERAEMGLGLVAFSLLVKDSRAFLATTELRGRTAIRVCFANWRTTSADVEEIVRSLNADGSRAAGGSGSRKAAAELAPT